MKTMTRFLATCLTMVFVFSAALVPGASASGEETFEDDPQIVFSETETFKWDEMFEVNEAVLETEDNDAGEVFPEDENDCEESNWLESASVQQPGAEKFAVPDTYAFFAEDYAQAQEISESLGGSLTSFQYGIGTLWLDTHCVAYQAEADGASLDPEYEYTVSQSEQAQNVPMVSTVNGMAQWHLTVLNAAQAWENAKGKGVLVAVIDTGIDSGHADLSDAVISAETAIPADYYAEEGMFPAEYQGGGDNLGHGTHVAGIIGARENGVGCTGIAPESSILSIKALERYGTQGKGRSSWVAAAVAMAVEEHVDIINLSVGGTVVRDELLYLSIQRAVDAGIAVVCAAGNTNTPVLMYPAAYEETIAVSALKAQGDSVTFASGYSNSGDWIDFSAPGSSILSTIPGGYDTRSGTSMACPMVSGALALLYSSDPLLTTKQAVSILRGSALDLGEPGKDARYGYGALDLQKMTQLHQQLLRPALPSSSIPSDCILYQNSPISISTETLHGKTVYTLDDSEPNADSAVWPDEPRTFSEEIQSVSITARTLTSDGTLGERVHFCYHFVPRITVLEREEGTVSDEIPGYGELYPDPVLNKPCRRYQIRVEPKQELHITSISKGANIQVFLFDGEDGQANQLEFTANRDGVMWRSSSEEAVTVYLSLVVKETAQLPEDLSYSFRYSLQDVQEDPDPTEPEPTEPTPTEPTPTEPTPTEPKSAERTPTEPKPTEPKPEQSATQPTLHTETSYTEWEEDWLYAMDEDTETVNTVPQPEPLSGNGGNTSVDTMDFRFLMAGGVIVLFGTALILLGYFTGRRSWQLLRTGQTATATVLRITRCPDYRTFRYQLAYRTKDGQQITARWKVYPNIHYVRRHPEGSTLRIRYLPQSPKEFMVGDHPVDVISSACCLIVGVGVIVLGICIACCMFTLG